MVKKRVRQGDVRTSSISNDFSTTTVIAILILVIFVSLVSISLYIFTLDKVKTRQLEVYNGVSTQAIIFPRPTVISGDTLSFLK